MAAKKQRIVKPCALSEISMAHHQSSIRSIIWRHVASSSRHAPLARIARNHLAYQWQWQWQQQPAAWRNNGVAHSARSKRRIGRKQRPRSHQYRVTRAGISENIGGGSGGVCRNGGGKAAVAQIAKKHQAACSENISIKAASSSSEKRNQYAAALSNAL